MEHIIFLYVFFTGCVYTSWMWDTTAPFWLKFMNICFGFINGWYITPILIGRAIRQGVIKDCKKPASQNDFKPYQKVLVRLEDGESWEADLFSTYKPLCDNPYHCVGGWWPQCIPYEGNEYLLDRQDSCDKYYITREK